MAVLHTFRSRNGVETKSIYRSKAIRLFCMECMGYEFFNVRACTDRLCPLFPFRMGNEKGLEIGTNTEDCIDDLIDPPDEEELDDDDAA